MSLVQGLLAGLHSHALFLLFLQNILYFRDFIFSQILSFSYNFGKGTVPCF